jgi:uncharacterized protein YyaL (SSP411 family)
MNQLQNETSPYLLQHKDNPVNWYPWGKAAISKAKKEDKPILLSIGYSTCHWCHVMAHESFENKEIAKLMNENFINIKLDREERPDIDSLYMNYVQLTTGSGGWPLTVFLTPDLIPFFGGTYFPPEDKYGRPGFRNVLESISRFYRNKKDELISQKDEIIKALNNVSVRSQVQPEFTKTDFDIAFTNIQKKYDEEFGGFGLAPKFPQSMTLMFLLDFYSQSKNDSAVKMVENSLQKMAKGGIYDQIGGGFHRYSTDNNWLIPHFEKMLYDNALLSGLYLNTYRLTKNDFYLQVAVDILDYILREMTDSSGGFYSAQDADSGGEEGKFYVWEYEEFKKQLSEEEFKIAIEYFGITKSGNFEGKNILTVYKSIKELADLSGTNEKQITEKLEIIHAKLLEYRETRVKPGLDNKILSSLNGLMLNSFCLAYNITGNEKFKYAALKNGEFIWNEFFKEPILFHSYSKGKLKYKGYLDNYSFVADAFISLYNVTFNSIWLERADTFAKLIIKYFYNEENGDFYFTSPDNKDVLVRTREIYDNATPNGASVAAYVLLRLAVYMNENRYIEIAERYISNLRDYIINYPLSFSYILKTAYFGYIKQKEVTAVVRDLPVLKEFTKEFWNEYFPFTILAAKLPEDKSQLELLKDKNLIKGEKTIYVCENYTCQSPVSSFEEMKKLILND